jgi:hypothetical protein
MPTQHERTERVRALLSDKDTCGRQLLRQVTHDINGPLFAFSLDLDLFGDALTALKAAIEEGNAARARDVLDSMQDGLRNLESANTAAAAYVREVQAIADSDDAEGEPPRPSSES